MMVKVRIRKDIYHDTNWSWVDYHLFEGYGIDFVKEKEMTNCFKLYFDTYKTQREVVKTLQGLGVDTGWEMSK